MLKYLSYYLFMLRLFISTLLIFFSSSLYADVSCKPSSTPLTSTVTLNGVYYIGNEMPVGTVIYRTQIKEADVTGIHCDGAFSVPRMLGIASEPSGTSSSIPVPGYTGEIYPTNIPGISAAILFTNITITQKKPLNAGGINFANTNTSGGDFRYQGVVDLSLIKTGSFAPGTVVNGNSLPTIIVYAGNSTSYSGVPGYIGLPITVDTINFSGSIKFVGGTCTTPSYTVNMGSYEIKDYFTGKGSTSPWIDASIKLTGCPAFTGYHNDTTYQNVTGTGTPTGGPIRNNAIDIDIKPATAFVDKDNGIFALQPSGSSPTAAGVGFQLGYTPLPNGTVIPPTTIFNGANIRVYFPKNMSGNISIPLAARYYQTGQNATPGKANGMVTYIITYK